MTCPVGTSPYETKSLQLGTAGDATLVDVSGGPSSEAEGGIGYVVYAEESCTFACVAIQACPEGSVPIITRDCYTCAPITESGDILSGICDYEGSYVDSEGTTSPGTTEEEDDWTPPEDDEIPGSDGQAPSCRTSWRTIYEGDFDENGSQDSEYDDHLDETQELGEINRSLQLSGMLDRREASEEGCVDVDVFEGEYTCEGTASLTIATSSPMAVEVEVGGTSYSRSADAIEVTPGPFRVTARCTDDWGGYDVEVRFGD
ncbi:MAG: hypothetical protein CL927_08240 [Deltaproteobacteria bacterium]|nr:hypothetical protein [Deltaproteobacteria bacterium]HCH64319.1 hypothetical protein [Deltaproteobacteria bacterium]